MTFFIFPESFWLLLDTISPVQSGSKLTSVDLNINFYEIKNIQLFKNHIIFGSCKYARI